MPSRRKQAKAVPFNPAEVANIAKSNPYVQRLIEDASLRERVRAALDSTRNLYERLTDGKVSAKALFDDKKVQAELRKAVEAIRDVTTALTEEPKRRARRRLRLPRKLLIAGIGGGLALAGSEQLRSKVLDLLFGAEEEFEYTPPAAAGSSGSSSAEASGSAGGGAGGSTGAEASAQQPTTDGPQSTTGAAQSTAETTEQAPTGSS